MNYKSITGSLACIALFAGITSADINIEKIKRKSYDLADLVQCILEEKEPRLDGKKDRDEYGYFVQCFMPDDAIKVFAAASGSEITKIEKNRYVLVRLEKGGGIFARLKGNRLYIEKVADLEAYKRKFSKVKEVKKIEKKETAETYEIPQETLKEEYAEPEILEEEITYESEAPKEIEEEIPTEILEKMTAEEEKIPAETPEEMAAGEEEIPVEILEKMVAGEEKIPAETPEEIVEETAKAEEPAEEKSEKSEESEYPDYFAPLGKIFEQNPALSYLVNCKINDINFSEEELKKYPEIEKISKMREGDLVSDYVLRSEKPSKDIKIIKKAFGVKKNLFKLNDNIWLKISQAGKKLIAIQKIKR